MREKLKASYIAKLKCPKERDQIKVFDTEVTGLAVRVTRLGVKTFIFEKRPRGSKKVKQEKIGSCLDFSIEKAREVAREKSLAYSKVDYIKNLREADRKIPLENPLLIIATPFINYVDIVYFFVLFYGKKDCF